MTKRKTNPTNKAKEGAKFSTGASHTMFPQLPPDPPGSAFWQCPGTSQAPRDVSANPYRSIFSTNRYDRSMWNDNERSLPEGWGMEFRPKGEKGFYKTYFCPRGRAWASLVKVLHFVAGGCNYSTLTTNNKVSLGLHCTFLFCLVQCSCFL
jgi:hypothetical protein